MKDIKLITDGGRLFSATRQDEDFLAALKAEPRIIFDLSPDLMNISSKVKKAHECGKLLFAHIDLASGIGKDESGIRFLMRVGADGIISTKSGMIKLAKECGMYTVQRFFIVDSHSVGTTAETVRSAKPDMIEIMPGTVCKIIGKLKNMTDIPIIAGGLIEREDEVREALECGAFAVSTGCRSLWNIAKQF